MKCFTCRQFWLRFAVWSLCSIGFIGCLLASSAAKPVFWLCALATAALVLLVRLLKSRADRRCALIGCRCRGCDHPELCFCGCPHCCANEEQDGDSEENPEEDEEPEPESVDCEDCYWYHRLPASQSYACRCPCHR